MRPRSALALSLALTVGLSFPAVAQEAAPAADPVPGPAECMVRDTTGMITLVICPEDLDAADLQEAGIDACNGREPCLAWIWDNPEAVPESAPPTSEGLGGDALAAALAVWVQDDGQLILMEQPYTGIGGAPLDDEVGEPDPLLAPTD